MTDPALRGQRDGRSNTFPSGSRVYRALFSIPGSKGETQVSKIYRQGDVLIVSVDALPEGEAAPIPRDERGRIVLAHGEVTGHAHAVLNPEVAMMRAVTGQVYLISDQSFQVRHEEHTTVDVPAGIFEVIRQREYSPEAVRWVAD